MILTDYFSNINREDKIKNNSEIRNALLSEYRIIDRIPENPDEYDIIYALGTGPLTGGYNDFIFHKLPDNLSIEELGLIADEFYALMFGFERLTDNACRIYTAE